MNRPHEYDSISLISKEVASKLIDPLIKLDGDGHQIQIVSFFAEWCPNCMYEAVSIQSLYNEYKTQRVGMTLVMDYAPRSDSDQFIHEYKINIPVKYGEIDEKDEVGRSDTVFYKFRKFLGDERGWGLPTHLIIEKEENKIGVIFGEIIESEIRSYLNKKLINL